MGRSADANRPRDSLISADDNRRMFDAIAGYYDSTNRFLTGGLDAYWRRRAVACLAPTVGGLYLDVGCGTGDVALEIVRQAAGSRVVGIDPSQGMLDLGRNKVSQAGQDRAIQLVPGDGLALPFPDGRFDGVITSFCIRNVTDRRGALAEFQRVLRPNGRLVILELTDPVGLLMKPLFRVYSNLVMPLVTRFMSSAPAYRYLTASMTDFPSAERFKEIMETVGFKHVQFFRMTGGITTCFFGTPSAETYPVTAPFLSPS
jgi:demethylmenaquinone methyltransferase/2-methoxy-6-polyprenyl-1,4-benzoquinol methylase